MEIKQFETPILFMVFNRPDATARVFEEIRKIRPTMLFIHAEGPNDNRPEDIEDCRKVREIVSNIDWPCDVKKWFRDTDVGCQLGPSGAVTWFFENVPAGIILEDDCLPHPSFFLYCAELLEHYKNDERILQISGDFFQEKNTKFKNDTSYFFSNIGYLWGWASWRRAWKYYDLDMTSWPESKKSGVLRKLLKDPAVYEYWEKLWDNYYNGQKNSWDRPWAYAFMMQNGLSINPGVNLISNIGFNNKATHTKNPESELANMPTHEIKFPLIHPKKVEPNLQADAFAFKYQYGINLKLKDRFFGPFRRKFPDVYNKTKTLFK